MKGWSSIRIQLHNDNPGKESMKFHHRELVGMIMFSVILSYETIPNDSTTLKTKD